MNEQSFTGDTVLEAECSAFCNYLVGRDASEYIRRQYREAHQRTDLVHQNPSNSFDRFIIHFGQKGIFSARMADIYTRWFYRHSALRSKLLLLMAILECSKSTYNLFEADQPYSTTRFWLFFIGNGIRWFLCFVLSFIFFSLSYLIVKCVDILRKL